MDQFLGAFFGSIVGMFAMGVVLTLLQNAQRAKQSKQIDEAAKQMSIRLNEAMSRVNESHSFELSRGDA